MLVHNKVIKYELFFPSRRTYMSRRVYKFENPTEPTKDLDDLLATVFSAPEEVTRWGPHLDRLADNYRTDYNKAAKEQGGDLIPMLNILNGEDPHPELPKALTQLAVDAREIVQKEEWLVRIFDTLHGVRAGNSFREVIKPDEGVVNKEYPEQEGFFKYGIYSANQAEAVITVYAHMRSGKYRVGK
jgi:hypothetical protein